MTAKPEQRTLATPGVSTLQFSRFADRSALVAALREEIAAWMRDALQARGRVLLALSGGNTPLPLYAALAAMNFDWPRVAFALVDERWVEASTAASNEYQLRHVLSPALAAGARFTGMKNHFCTAIEGRAQCEESYRQLPLPFDLLLLGMGDDGHIASLFPAAEGLSHALDPLQSALCSPIIALPSEVTGPLIERMSLTRAGLLRARRIDLMLAGDKKRAVFESAHLGTDAQQLPVRAVMQQNQVPLRTWWAP